MLVTLQKQLKNKNPSYSNIPSLCYNVTLSILTLEDEAYYTYIVVTVRPFMVGLTKENSLGN